MQAFRTINVEADLFKSNQQLCTENPLPCPSFSAFAMRFIFDFSNLRKLQQCVSFEKLLSTHVKEHKKFIILYNLAALHETTENKLDTDFCRRGRQQLFCSFSPTWNFNTPRSQRRSTKCLARMTSRTFFTIVVA